jgi:RNA recognition motif-containing protein
MAAAASSTPPSPSLYVKNLDTRTKKPELARQLYVLFGAYGKVLDVVATRAAGMRGQAFVVFREQQAATAARRALDGFEFYGKALVSGGALQRMQRRGRVRACSAARHSHGGRRTAGMRQ